jgi:hypothetical protein
MVPGFNTDFKYRGETYHVQTEDNGVGNPVVVTLLYHKGAILASRRTPYRTLLEKPGFEKELMELMKSQHKEIMRDLLAGAYDQNGTAPAAPSGTGEHPAAAAAAVAAQDAPAPAPQRSPPPRASIPAAAAALSQPRKPAAATLDEAIMSYLQEYAAASPVTAAS